MSNPGRSEIESRQQQRSNVVRSGAIDWRAFDEAPGVSFKLLRRHPEQDGVTILIRFAPGSAYPAHRHPAGEEYYVLEGSIEDGGRTYHQGDHVSYPPGSSHRPSSCEGCVVLIVLPAGIELIADPPRAATGKR